MRVSISNSDTLLETKKINFEHLSGKTKNSAITRIQGRTNTEISKLKPLLGYADNPSLLESPN